MFLTPVLSGVSLSLLVREQAASHIPIKLVIIYIVAKYGKNRLLHVVAIATVWMT
jgi:hypothetical protein